MFSMAFVKPLMAHASAKVETMSLVEMFYQSNNRMFCDEKGQTVWDTRLVIQKKYLDEVKDCDGLSETDCTAMFTQYLSMEISGLLTKIPSIYYTLNFPSKDTPLNQESVMEDLLDIKNKILDLLIIRDAVEGDDLFNEIFDIELKNLANNDSVSIFLKKDKNLYNEIASLKTFYPELPYGENVWP